MSTPSKLDDPKWRRERAARAGRTRTTLAYHVAKVVENATELTPELISQLRQLPGVAA